MISSSSACSEAATCGVIDVVRRAADDLSGRPAHEDLGRLVDQHVTEVARVLHDDRRRDVLDDGLEEVARFLQFRFRLDLLGHVLVDRDPAAARDRPVEHVDDAAVRLHEAEGAVAVRRDRVADAAAMLLRLAGEHADRFAVAHQLFQRAARLHDVGRERIHLAVLPVGHGDPPRGVEHAQAVRDVFQRGVEAQIGRLEIARRRQDLVLARRARGDRKRDAERHEQRDAVIDARIAPGALIDFVGRAADDDDERKVGHHPIGDQARNRIDRARRVPVASRREFPVALEDLRAADRLSEALRLRQAGRAAARADEAVETDQRRDPVRTQIDRAIERLELLRIEHRDDQPGKRAVGRGEPAAERDRPRARALEPIGLADEESVLAGCGVLAECVEAADVEADRSLRGGGDDAVPVGETEMQRDLLAGGEGLRPCGEIELRRIPAPQFPQQQQRIVGAADRARDVLLEDARVGLALGHGRVVGARLLMVGEIEQRGAGKDQQRDAEIGERLSERAHPGSQSRPPHRLLPRRLGPRLKRDVLRTCSFRWQPARQFSNRLTNSQPQLRPDGA